MSSTTAPPDAHGTEPGYLTPKGGFWTTVWDWMTTVDHKKIGVMYLFAVLFFFFLGGVFALAVRLELLTPEVGDLTIKSFLPGVVDSPQDAYNRAFTMHGAIMTFLFIIPSIPASIGNFVLPLMLGAKDVAFPKLNLASWYIFLAGAMLAMGSALLGGVDTGWTFYTPYSTSTAGIHTQVILMTMGVFVMGFSSILTGLNFIVTIHKLRAPGMGWFDMPLLLWALYATALIQILATPVIGITTLLLTIERVFKIGIFDPALGGEPVLYQHFFWFYSHPAVYIMILPGMGVISEMITVHSRKHIFGYKTVAYSSLGIAAVSFLVWGHHMFTSMSEVAVVIFSGLTFLVAIPSAIKVFNWLSTLYRGSIALTTPMLYTLAFLFNFGIGGLTGLFLATIATDKHLHDTYFVVAHFHYVMMGSTGFAFVGALHHWWPKMFGKVYNPVWANVGGVMVFFGFNLTFLPQFVAGTRGMPRRYASYLPEFEVFNQWSTYGSWLLGAGFLVHLAVFIHSLAAGKNAAANPWGALSMEWETDGENTPIEHNFHGQPVMKHGPYDYGVAVPPRTAPGEFPLLPESERNRYRH